MADPNIGYLAPEARARVEIDRMLGEAGWAVQNAAQVNLAAKRGVAVREFVMAPPHGRADYLLFLDGRAAGIVEAKKEGETLIGVEHQSAKYVDGLPEGLVPAVEGGLPFVYESTGTETRFTNRLDPEHLAGPAALHGLHGQSFVVAEGLVEERLQRVGHVRPARPWPAARPTWPRPRDDGWAGARSASPRRAGSS